MKITELRCPACNGTMKISEKNPNIAVCEYCHSQYVLEWEGGDAKIGNAMPQRPPMTDYSTKKENPAAKILAAAGVFLILAGGVTAATLMGSGKKTADQPSVSLPKGQTAAVMATTAEEKSDFKGILADAAGMIFERPAEEVTEAELSKIRYLRVGYANSGESIRVEYSMDDPIANPDVKTESLYFDRTGADLDFDALARYTGLQSLEVLNYLPDGCLAGLNLECLSCYGESPEQVAGAFESTEGLKELKITAGLDGISGLELFPTVERLTLDAYDLTDISELASAKNVKYLTLDGCDAVKDFSVLSVMTWLEGLSVDSENLKALTFLSKMPALKELELHNGGMLNLSGLSDRADTLEALVLESCDEINDCSEVSSLTNLKRLEIDVPYNCPAPDLSGLTAMEELVLSGFDNSSFLGAMPNLKKLSLSSSAVSDTSVFKSLTNLEELRCTSYSGSQDSLSFIAGLPALKRLDISGASTYYDISDLFNVPTLEYFNLNGVECEINFDKLGDNPALKEIHMDGIKLYKNVKIDGGGGIMYVDWDDVVLDEHTGFLAHYPGLETLTVADNELTQAEFAAGLGNLKTLDISENYVTDIKSLSSAASLKTVIVTGNPIDNLRVLDEKVQIIQ